MSPSHFDFPQQFRAIYDHALKAYQAGKATAAELFDPDQKAWLDANGIGAQAMFDYAEDDLAGGLPGFGHALAIVTIRRDYFLNAQNGVASTVVADADAWPSKAEAIDGITWLPRILPKVRAKLRSELPASMMYCCGGDRNFFRTHDILPAEFLHLAWRHFDDDAAIIAWVKQRSRAA